MVKTRIPTLLAALLLPATGLFSACAAKQLRELSPPSEPAKVSPAMSETSPSSSPVGDAQTLTPQQAGHRLLQLVDSIKTPADFSLDRFNTVMRLPEPQRADAGPANAEPGYREPGYQEFSEAVAGSEWTYVIAYSEDSTAAGAKKIEYRLEYQGAQADDSRLDLAPVCAMDYAAWRRGLLEIGFEEGPAMASVVQYPSEGVLAQGFKRRGLNVDLVTQRESAASEARPAHVCVRSIEVRLGADAVSREEG